MSLDPEVRRGGNLPFGMVASKWMCDPRYSTNARTLYAILVTYADTQSRDTGRGKPYRPELARQLGVSPSTLDRTLDELEVAGLVRIEERVDPANPKKNDANVYHLADFPLMYAGNGEWLDPLPPGANAAEVAKQRTEERRRAKREKGIERKGGVPKGVSTRALKAAREVAAQEGATSETEPEGGSTHAATPSSTHAATPAAPMLPNVYNPVHNPYPDQKPGSAGGQGAGGFARAGTREGAAPEADTAAGGYAADQTAPQTQTPAEERTKKAPAARKVTPPRPVAGEDDVWRMLDTVLVELGQRQGGRPPTLRKAVRLMLGHDTDARGGTAFALYPRRAEHALLRINRGWYRARGPERSAPGYDGPDLIRRPIGYLAQILTAHDCLRPECEQGILLTTGAECDECEQIKAERIAQALATRLEQGTAAQAAQPAPGPASGQEGQEDDDVYRMPEQRRTTWWCETESCRRPGRGVPPEVLLCDECLVEIETVLRELDTAPSQ